MNKAGPKTDPYGTPCSSRDQELSNLLIFFINLASLPAVWHIWVILNCAPTHFHSFGADSHLFPLCPIPLPLIFSPLPFMFSPLLLIVNPLPPMCSLSQPFPDSHTIQPITYHSNTYLVPVFLCAFLLHMPMCICNSFLCTWLLMSIYFMFLCVC